MIPREPKGIHHQSFSVVQFVPPAAKVCAHGRGLPSPTDVFTVLFTGSRRGALQRREGDVFLSHCTSESSISGLGTRDLERVTTGEMCVGVEVDISRKIFFFWCPLSKSTN